MPKIALAYWHGGHAPGDEIDVTDAELKALRRDGRVAAVLSSQDVRPASVPPVPAAPVQAPALASPETEEPHAAPPEAAVGRRKGR
jgi:hypothetical protein